MMIGRPILEEDLHAFVDQVLSPAHQAEVQAYLDQHADAAARVAGYVRERDALRAALAPVAEEPIPPRLNVRHLARMQRSTWQVPWRAAAAAILLVAIGTAAGWSLHGVPTGDPLGVSAQNGTVSFAQEADYTYGVYGQDQVHPVEFKAAERAQFADWIAGRLQHAVSVPDLSASGWRFLGGRLVAPPHGPAGLMTYENGDGLRLAIMVRMMETDKNTRMQPHSDGVVQGYAWSDRGIGYSLVGPTSPEVLHPLADEVRRQVRKDV